MPALTDRSSSGGTWRLVRVGGVIAALGVFLFLGRRLGSYVPVFATWVNELGPWGPLAFIAGYAVSVVLLVPAVLLTLAGGAVFGLMASVISLTRSPACSATIVPPRIRSPPLPT